MWCSEARPDQLPNIRLKLLNLLELHAKGVSNFMRKGFRMVVLNVFFEFHVNVLDVLAKVFRILIRKCLEFHAEEFWASWEVSGVSCERFLISSQRFYIHARRFGTSCESFFEFHAKQFQNIPRTCLELHLNCLNEVPKTVCYMPCEAFIEFIANFLHPANASEYPA